MENIIYYIFLFILVLTIRFFKLKNTHKSNFNVKWKEVFYSSLEIVYTASGVVIALLLNVSKDWIAPVVIVYLVIVIFSALLEMSNDNFNDLSKTSLHVVIIFIVVTSTILTYKKVIPKKVDIEGKPTDTIASSVIKPKSFTILIPYYDHSLIRHVGNNKLKEIPQLYQTTISTSTKDSAYTLIMKKIASNNKIITPIIKNSSSSDIEIDREKVMIIETKKLNECYPY